MRNPTIAIVITKLELGGAQQVALAVARAIAARRARVLFVAGAEGLLRPECEAIPHLEPVFLPELLREVRPAMDLRALSALRSLFRRERADIVHTHSSKAGILGRVAARLAGVPHIVHTVHGFGFHDYQRPAARAAFRAAEKLAGAFTERFVLVSRENLERGVAAGVLDRRRSVVIRAGVEIERFRSGPIPRSRVREALGLGEGDLVVGGVACLKPQKAPLDFVKVAREVVTAVPSAKFLLAGDGELRPEVESAIAELGLSGSVRLLGWRDDIPDLMRSFDLFLLTSLWEGLPMVLPQARAAGLPIVATDVNGNAEAVARGVHGELCPPGDVAAISRACVALLSDAGRRAEIGRRTGEGLDEFSVGDMVARHVHLYEELWGAPIPVRDASGA
ncbi:MAG: glycosyltransferase family 4 protein [Acidobacteriota bacterium]